MEERDTNYKIVVCVCVALCVDNPRYPPYVPYPQYPYPHYSYQYPSWSEPNLNSVGPASAEAKEVKEVKEVKEAKEAKE